MIMKHRIPRKANIYLAIIYFIFNKNKFITLGVENRMAHDLEKEEYKDKLQRGEYSLEPLDHINASDTYLRDLRVLLVKSFCFICIAISFAFVVSLKIKNIHTLTLKDFCSFIGTILMSWSTLFQLGWNNASWKGVRLDELVRLAIFKMAFTFGTFLCALSFFI